MVEVASSPMERPGLVDRLTEAVRAQRGQSLAWSAVAFGTGIGGYFSLRSEPTLEVLVGLGAVTALGGAGYVWRRHDIGPLFLIVAILCSGVLFAAWRTAAVWGPVVDWRYYGPVEGRVVAIDRSASDKTRLTLDQVSLNRVGPEETPNRVRISLHGDAEASTILPGARVMTTGHLSAPPGPTEPGGFDFQRYSYFKELGAVGYTRVPVLIWAPPDAQSWRLWIFERRMAISAALQDVLPGQRGAVAAAITVGDRSAMTAETYDSLRFSNLAHLLAISGLHMGLLTGFVFAALKFVLSAVPWVAVRWPVKKIAAATAIVCGAIYLALSGGAIATERAFIMVTVIFIAVLIDRRALTLRAVALAALVVLALRPEAILSPGFQMSFAATTALVLFFGWFSRFELPWIPRRLRGVLSLFLASFIAGGATAPIAAAHFNVISHYGLVANMVSVPVMGTFIMPAAVLAALTWPLGLEGLPLWVMEQGLGWILWVGGEVSGWPGAVGRVKAPAGWVLALIAGGALWAVLWCGRAWMLGAGAMIAAFGLWTTTDRPAILISGRSALVGVMTEDGRVLSRSRGEGFAARTWIENDGGRASQEAASAGWPGTAEALGLRIIHVHGKREVAALRDCRGADWVITSHPAPDLPCRVFDPDRLRQTGAIAVYPGPDGPRIATAREIAGRRPWNTDGVRAARWIGDVAGQ